MFLAAAGVRQHGAAVVRRVLRLVLQFARWPRCLDLAADRGGAAVRLAVHRSRRPATARATRCLAARPADAAGDAGLCLPARLAAGDGELSLPHPDAAGG